MLLVPARANWYQQKRAGTNKVSIGTNKGLLVPLAHPTGPLPFSGPIAYLVRQTNLSLSATSFGALWSFPSVVFSSTILVIFSWFKFSSRIINWLSKSTLGIYLIHDNTYMRRWLWKGANYFKVSQHSTSDSTGRFIGYTIGLILLIYGVCALVETCRLLLFKIPVILVKYCRSRRNRGKNKDFSQSVKEVEMEVEG